MPVFSDFAGVLAAARKRAGIGQRELANELQVHPVTISNWERGEKVPDDATKRRVAAYLRPYQPEVDELTLALEDIAVGGRVRRVSEAAADRELPRQFRILAAEFEVEALKLGATEDEMAYVRHALESPETARMFAYGYVDRTGLSADAMRLDYEGLIEALRTYVKMRVQRRTEAKRRRE